MMSTGTRQSSGSSPSPPIRCVRGPALPAHLHACFDLVMANHVLYYVPNLHGTLSALLRTLDTPGLFLAAMAGRANTMAQFCLRCFDLIGKPYPFHTSEDCETALAGLGEAYCTEDVHYELVFPDADENRLSMGRFLMGDDFHAVPRRAMLQCFDPYAHAGQITMQLVHKHIILRRQVQGRELLEARAQPSLTDSPLKGSPVPRCLL